MAVRPSEVSAWTWDLRTGQTRRYVRAGRAPVAFSRDGLRIAWGSSKRQHVGDGMYDAPDGSVWIENLSTEELRKLQGHTMGGWIGRFSRTGKWLATGGGDAESILWDV